MKQFTPVPQMPVADLPPFMRGRYADTPVFDTRYMLKLSRWAELEYNDAKVFFSSSNMTDALRLLNSVEPYIAQAHIVASTKEFSVVVKNMTDEIWLSYPDVLRKFISECYRIYTDILKK